MDENYPELGFVMFAKGKSPEDLEFADLCGSFALYHYIHRTIADALSNSPRPDTTDEASAERHQALANFFDQHSGITQASGRTEDQFRLDQFVP